MFEIYNKEGNLIWGPGTVSRWCWENELPYLRDDLSESEQLGVVRRWWQAYLGYKDVEVRVCSELEFLV